MNLVAKQMANDRSAISNSYTVRKGNQEMKITESIFDCHNDFYSVQGVCGQILHQIGFHVNFRLINL